MLDKYFPLIPTDYLSKSNFELFDIELLSIYYGITPHVDIKTIIHRISTIYKNTRIPNGQDMVCAIKLDNLSYMNWTRKRKTYIVCCGRIGCLSYVYDVADSPSVSFSVFRQRIVKIDNITIEYIDMALNTNNEIWKGYVGSGRSAKFTYLGNLYPQLYGTEFPSIVNFLDRIGRRDYKTTVWSRLKNKWDIYDALTEKIYRGSGCIYMVEHIGTGLKYVGLTTGPIERRFKLHLISARKGSRCVFHHFLREYGAKEFKLSLVEEKIPSDRLGEREKYWISTINTAYPDGMNSTSGGETGNIGGKRTVYGGIEYPSISYAARTLCEQTGLPYHIVLRCIIKQKELPTTYRKKSQHPDSLGSSPYNDIWRIHKSLLRRVSEKISNYQIDPLWTDYNRFKNDILPSRISGYLLIQADPNIDLGPQNFKWSSKKQIIESRNGIKMTYNTEEYSSLAALAIAVGIKYTTLKYRIASGMSLTEAVSLGPAGVTSPVQCEYDGIKFRSLHEAAKYMANKLSIPYEKARYELRKSR